MTFKIKTVRKVGVPDERQVMESMARWRHDMRAHARMLWIIIGGVAVVTAGAGGMYFVSVQADHAARDQLQQAAQLYMNRPLNDTDASLSHVRQSVEQFRIVVENYPHSSSAPLAMHLLANALSVLGDYSGAIALYQQFIETYPSHETLNALVRQRLAYAYLQQGDLKAAEGAFEKILAIDMAPNKDLALLELASLGEQQNQPEAALARYQQLIKGYPYSIYLSEASSKVRVLGGGNSVLESPLPDPETPESNPPSQTTK